MHTRLGIKFCQFFRGFDIIKLICFIQHFPEYPAACCGDEWLNTIFLRGAIPQQEGAGFIELTKENQIVRRNQPNCKQRTSRTPASGSSC